MELQREKTNEPKLELKHRMNFILTMASIVLLALVSATYAWFTLSATNQLDMLSINATAGTKLRFDVVNHGNNVDDYIRRVNTSRIDEQLSKKGRPSLKSMELGQYSSANGYEFYDREGNENGGDPVDIIEEDGLLIVDFWFVAESDMYVHLSPITDTNSTGTRIRPADDSEKSRYAYESCRISFISEDGECAIYQPTGFGDTVLSGQSTTQEPTKMFTFPDNESEFEYSEENTLFFLKKNQNKKVTMYIWLEGLDPDATDKSKAGSVSFDLKFVGTDENNNVIY